MNNRGYALTGILYTALIVFATIMISMLMNLQNRNSILNELKEDSVEAINSSVDYNYLYQEVSQLKTENEALRVDVNTLKNSTKKELKSADKTNISVPANTLTKLTSFTVPTTGLYLLNAYIGSAVTLGTTVYSATLWHDTLNYQMVGNTVWNENGNPPCTTLTWTIWLNAGDVISARVYSNLANTSFAYFHYILL